MSIWFNGVFAYCLMRPDVCIAYAFIHHNLSYSYTPFSVWFFWSGVICRFFSTISSNWIERMAAEFKWNCSSLKINECASTSVNERKKKTKPKLASSVIWLAKKLNLIKTVGAIYISSMRRFYLFVFIHVGPRPIHNYRWNNELWKTF